MGDFGGPIFEILGGDLHLGELSYEESIKNLAEKNRLKSRYEKILGLQN